MDPHEKDKPLRSFVRYFLVFVIAMGVVWWLSSLGPDSVDSEASFSQELFDDEEQEGESGQLLQRSQAIEEEFDRVRAQSDTLQSEAVILLEEAIRLQRAYIDQLGRVDVQAIGRLKRLETRLHNEQADVLLEKSITLESEGREALAQGDQEAAANALYQAAYLQKEINETYPLSNASDYGRPVRLSRLIQDLEAKPLSSDSYQAEREAREALAKGDINAAKEAFAEALDIQNTINKEYKNTQYVDLHRVRVLRGDLQNLDAQDLQQTFSDVLSQAKARDEAQAYSEAVGLYARALQLQEEINARYPDSRYASSGRVSAIRSAIQVAQGQVALEGLMGQLKALNQALAANQPEDAVLQLVEIQKIWPSLKSKHALALQEHEGLVERVDYLISRKDSLGYILETVYSSLQPLSHVSQARMLKTEVPQALYRKVMGKNPSRNVGDTLPVDSVRYEDATLFCTRLSMLVGREVKLPDESMFMDGVGRVDSQKLPSETWNADNSDYKTHPVGTRAPNSQGFFDLLGNVAEWLDSESLQVASVAGGSIEDSPVQLAKIPVGHLPKPDRSRNVGFRFILVE